MAYADTQDGETVVVKTDYTEKHLIRSVPGTRWDPRNHVWRLPLSWAACVTLRGVFGERLTIGEALNKWAWRDRETRVDPSLRLRNETHPTIDIPVYDTRLRDFQRVGVHWLTVAGDALLGDDMGSGKTIQALTAMRHMDDALPALVVCPNSVKLPWAREAEKWYPECHPYPLVGSTAERTKMLKTAMTDPTALVIINIESARLWSRLATYGGVRLTRCHDCDRYNGTPDLAPSRCEAHPKALNVMPFKTVICDEAHRIKDPHAKQTRAVWALMQGETVRRRWAMTGTPVANGPTDVWSLMHSVAPREYPTFGHFVDRYGLQAYNSYGMLDVVGLHPQTRDEFFRIFDPRYRAMPKALVLDQLPPKVRMVRRVDMTPKQAKAYKQLADRLVTRLEDGTLLVAPNQLVAATRLLQLSSSYCEIDGEGNVKLSEPSPKIDEMVGILGDMGQKQCVVAAQSRQLINLAATRLEKLGISHRLITGEVDQWDRERNLTAFQEGEVRVLLFTVAAGGTGLTMTAADTIIFLQRSWSMVDNKQAEDRVHRIGSEKHESIKIIEVVASGTIEEKTQIPRLIEKMERLEEISRSRALLTARGESTAELDSEASEILASNLGA